MAIRNSLKVLESTTHTAAVIGPPRYPLIRYGEFLDVCIGY